MEFTPEHVKEKVLAAGWDFIVSRSCSICSEPIGYEIRSATPYLDTRCGCGSRIQPQPSTWANVARLVNRLISEGDTRLAELMR